MTAINPLPDPGKRPISEPGRVKQGSGGCPDPAWPVRVVRWTRQTSTDGRVYWSGWDGRSTAPVASYVEEPK